MDTIRAPPPSRMPRRVMSLEDFVKMPILRRSRHTLDGAQNRHMGPAAAFEVGHGFTDFSIRGFWIIPHQGGGGHHPAIQAVAAKKSLLIHQSLLDGMRMFLRAKPRQSGDFRITDSRKGIDAGSRRRSVDMHRAGHELGTAEAKMRVVQSKHDGESVDLGHSGN